MIGKTQDLTLGPENKEDKILIRITAFSSDEISVRLSAMRGLDWCVAVEQVAIDTDYDGENFQPDIVDIPESAIYYVKGNYTMAEDKTGDCVAVKITDILGESVILTQDISVK